MSYPLFEQTHRDQTVAERLSPVSLTDNSPPPNLVPECNKSDKKNNDVPTQKPQPHKPLRDVEEEKSFGNLPVELRLKIWKYALPGPRIVKVRPYPTFEYQTQKLASMEEYMIRHGIISPTRPPVVLFVCRESRAEAQKTYKLSFGCENLRIPNTVYFNFEIDTLYFEPSIKKGPNGFTDVTNELKKFVWDWTTQPGETVQRKIIRLGANKVRRIGLSYIVVKYDNSNYLTYASRYLNNKHFDGLMDVAVVLDEVVLGCGKRDLLKISDCAALGELEGPDLESESKVMKAAGPFLNGVLIPEAKLWKNHWRAVGRTGRTNQDFIPELKIMKVEESLRG